MVIGPTPLGTGVITAALSFTVSKSTSPHSLPSTRLMPTSMTTAPFFTQSAVTRRGLPTDAIRISASAQISSIFLVLEWHMVTVALRFNSSCATGFPTILLRPMTTARRPLKSEYPAAVSYTHLTLPTTPYG